MELRERILEGYRKYAAEGTGSHISLEYDLEKERETHRKLTGRIIGALEGMASGLVGCWA
ncbi:MAG: hypothetical protein QXU67_02845 [Candidatus Bathyarchaeia archaeon]